MVDAMANLPYSARKSLLRVGGTAWSACFVAAVLAAHDARAQARAARATAPAVVAEFSVGTEGEPLIIPVLVRWRPTGARPAPPKTVCRMLVDTGSCMTLFHESHRAELGAPLARGATQGRTWSTDGEEFGAPAFEIGSETIRPSGSVVCVDMGPMMKEATEHYDGTIGMDVLGRLAMSIDFDLGKLRFRRGMGRGVERPVPIVLDAWGRPQISAELPDGTSEWFLIDTGTVSLSAGCLGAAPSERLVESGRLLPLSPRFFGSVVGLDGSFAGEMRSAIRFRVARYTHDNLIFHLVGENILGLGYLSRYIVTFDFPSRAMYLRPGKRFADADRVPLSGLALRPHSGAMRVEYVSPDRPAAAAGIAAGDLVTEIDGKETRSLTMLATQRLLAVPGRHVLLVARGAAEERVVLNLGASDPRGPVRSVP